MPGVTEEQITAAKQMSAIEFLRRYRPGQLVKAESRGEFQLKEHDSFKINETTSLWHWKSRDVGGKSALDYLIKVEGLKFVEAVQTLCEENPSYVPPVSQPEQPKEFLLPPAAENNRRVFAYLLKRGIDRKVIVVLGFNDAESVFYVDAFAALGCAVHVATIDGSAGTRGTVIDAIDAAGIKTDFVCSCGTVPMLKAVEARYSRGYMSFESRMACGIGACMACVAKDRKEADLYHRICKEGPVYPIGKVEF